MIPNLVSFGDLPWAVLPPGIHTAGLDEVRTRFATNTHRRSLFDGVVNAAGRLQAAGCLRIYLDGSYVTAKPQPRDFDACWDPDGVDESMLDPIFLDFSNRRAAQKSEFKGEFFPASMICTDVGSSFLEFFQIDRFTRARKGIVAVSLSKDPVLIERQEP